MGARLQRLDDLVPSCVYQRHETCKRAQIGGYALRADNVLNRLVGQNGRGNDPACANGLPLQGKALLIVRGGDGIHLFLG